MLKVGTAFNISDENIDTLQKLKTAEDIRLHATFGAVELASKDMAPFGVRELPFRVLCSIIAKIFNVQLCIMSMTSANSSSSYRNEENSFYVAEEMDEFDPRDILIVKDTFGDYRFHKDPLVVGPPSIRFYVELPIVVNKIQVATLSLIDQEKRLAFGLIEQKSLLQVAIMIANVHAQRKKFQGVSIVDPDVGKLNEVSDAVEQAPNSLKPGGNVDSTSRRHRRTLNPLGEATVEDYKIGLECNLLQVLHTTKCLLATAGGNIRKITWVIENSILSECKRHISHPYSITFALLLIYEHLLKYWVSIVNDISFRVPDEKFSVLDPPADPPNAQVYIVEKSGAQTPPTDSSELRNTPLTRKIASATEPVLGEDAKPSSALLEASTVEKPPMHVAEDSVSVNRLANTSAVATKLQSQSADRLPSISPRNNGGRLTPRTDSLVLEEEAKKGASRRKSRPSNDVAHSQVNEEGLPPISKQPSNVSSGVGAMAPVVKTSPRLGNEATRTKSAPRSDLEHNSELASSARRFSSEPVMPSPREAEGNTAESDLGAESLAGLSSTTIRSSPNDSFRTAGSSGSTLGVPVDRLRSNSNVNTVSKAKAVDTENEDAVKGYFVITLIASDLDNKSHLAPLAGLSLDSSVVNETLLNISGYMWKRESSPGSIDPWVYEMWIPCTLLMSSVEYQTTASINLQAQVANWLLNAAIAKTASEMSVPDRQIEGGGSPDTCRSSSGLGPSRSGSSVASAISVAASRSGSISVPSRSGSAENDGGSLSFGNIILSPGLPNMIGSMKASPQLPAASKDIVRVLVIEDSLIVQKLFVKTLKSHNCEVKIAKNGKIGLEMLKTNDFDITFMDFLMPVQDGLTTMRLFKEWLEEGRQRNKEVYQDAYVEGMGRNEQMLLIGISDIATKEEYQEAQQLDMHFFCKKPVTHELIASIIEARRGFPLLKDSLERVNTNVEKTRQRNNWDFFSWARGKLYHLGS